MLATIDSLTARDFRLIRAIEDDLQIKVDFCRTFGLSTNAVVIASTKQGGVKEVKGLEVWYIEKFLFLDSRADPHRFSSFSSPATQQVAPGRYLFWSRSAPARRRNIRNWLLSLLSSWVAIETINAFHRQKWADGKLFVGALLSDDFFRPEFRLECTRIIDERLETIERLLSGYREKMIDPVDLNDEKTRLYDLRNNPGSILANLKGSLFLDLRDEHFAESCRAIVKACRSPGVAAPDRDSSRWPKGAPRQLNSVSRFPIGRQQRKRASLKGTICRRHASTIPGSAGRRRRLQAAVGGFLRACRYGSGSAPALSRQKHALRHRTVRRVPHSIPWWRGRADPGSMVVELARIARAFQDSPRSAKRLVETDERCARSGPAR